MIDILLSVIAPHQCCGCGKTGTTLCDNCKYNITYDIERRCIVCQRPSSITGICKTCRIPYDRAWYVGIRKGTLQRLVGLYKFERVKAAYRQLGDLLLATIPDLPGDVVIVPVPTASSHIRERGYDHMHLIAKYVSQRRGLPLSRVLLRATQTKQRQASATKRREQAKNAFFVSKKLSRDTTYLLVDDIMTTGATVMYAAKALKNAGAGHVWLAVIGRQTLD